MDQEDSKQEEGQSAADSRGGATEPSNPVEAARVFGADVVHMVQTRLEILSSELAEERARLEQLVFLGVGFVVSATIFIIMLPLLLVVMTDDQIMREIIFAVIVGIYMIVALVTGLMLRNRLKNRPQPFQDTIKELEKDRDRLLKGLGRR